MLMHTRTTFGVQKYTTQLYKDRQAHAQVEQVHSTLKSAYAHKWAAFEVTTMSLKTL